MITEAIILAGGLGTRLKTVTGDTPKCMVPVNGIPFINFVISYLKNEGIDRFIFSLGYKAEVVIEYLDNHFKDLQKIYVVEHEPLGTGGAVKLACRKVKGSDTLVVNGDTLFNVNIKDFTGVHQMKNAAVTIALKAMNNFNRYGAVEIDSNFTLQQFREKEFCENGFINGGIYALNIAAFLSRGLPDVFSFEKDFLENNTGRITFCGLPYDNYFIDIGIPEDYNRFTDDFKLVQFKKKLSNAGGQNNFIGEAFFEGLFSLLD